ncbi:hypothetical protein X975_06603, partial [Stegodyphus mimosarum]
MLFSKEVVFHAALPPGHGKCEDKYKNSNLSSPTKSSLVNFSNSLSRKSKVTSSEKCKLEIFNFFIPQSLRSSPITVSLEIQHLPVIFL